MTNNEMIEYLNSLSEASLKKMFFFLRDYYCKRTASIPEEYRSELGNDLTRTLWDCYEPLPESDSVKLVFMAYLDAKYQYWKDHGETEEAISSFRDSLLAIA